METGTSEALQPLSPEVERTLLESRQRFLRFLERRVGNEAVAEELLQSALLRALEKGAPADQEGAVTWFYRVLRNALVDHYRRQESEARAVERREAEGASEALDPELKEGVCACLHELLPTLKPEYADVVRQVDLESRTLSDVAREAGITANNATVRLHRARQALRKQLQRSCGACATHGCLECSCGHSGATLRYTPRTP